MIRAARRAAALAKQHNQPLVFYRDGRVVHIMPDDLPPLPDIPEQPPERSQRP